MVGFSETKSLAQTTDSLAIGAESLMSAASVFSNNSTDLPNLFSQLSELFPIWASEAAISNHSPSKRKISKAEGALQQFMTHVVSSTWIDAPRTLAVNSSGTIHSLTEGYLQLRSPKPEDLNKVEKVSPLQTDLTYLSKIKPIFSILHQSGYFLERLRVKLNTANEAAIAQDLVYSRLTALQFIAISYAIAKLLSYAADPDAKMENLLNRYSSRLVNFGESLFKEQAGLAQLVTSVIEEEINDIIASESASVFFETYMRRNPLTEYTNYLTPGNERKAFLTPELHKQVLESLLEGTGLSASQLIAKLDEQVETFIDPIKRKAAADQASAALQAIPRYNPPVRPSGRTDDDPDLLPKQGSNAQRQPLGNLGAEANKSDKKTNRGLPREVARLLGFSRHKVAGADNQQSPSVAAA